MNRLFIYCVTRNEPAGFERCLISMGKPLARDDHFWIIETEKDTAQVRNALAPWLETRGDRLMVGELGQRISIGLWPSASTGELKSRFTVDGGQ
jgi:hypothetical protein